MARLPLDVSLAMVSMWLDTLPQAQVEETEGEQPQLSVVGEPPTAVDAVIPPGPANREVKRRLRTARRKAA
jgi:hypothetical protein